MNRGLFTLLLLVTVIKSGIGQDDVYIDFTKFSEIKAVVVANINGDVVVDANAADKLILRGETTHKGKNEDNFRVEHFAVDDTLVIYIKSPCNAVKVQPEEGYFNSSWAIYEWSDTDACKDQPDYGIDLDLSIPQDIQLAVSTINEGTIKVQGFTGHLWAKNINGPIFLQNVHNVHEARTINGDVTIHFASNPTVEGYYYTLNGDIESFYPHRADIDITFKSFNGDFYTDDDRLTTLPSTIVQKKTNSGFKIKISEESKMRIGKGGAIQRFETFNGDAIVRTKPKI